MYPLLRLLATRASVSSLFRHEAQSPRQAYTKAFPLPQFRPLIWGSVFAFSAVIASQSITHLDVNATEIEHTTVDPDTSITFPTTLRIPSKVPMPTFSLIGVGVRTVSFLKIKVYSVGFYADLSNPNLNVPKSATPQEKIEHIIHNTACVIRIIPTRNTSYTHLRDAFIRSLNARQQLAHQRGTLSSEEQLSVQSPIGKLKTIFPNAPLLKHTPLDLLLAPPDPTGHRTLIVRDLGAIQSDWVAQEIMLAYFEGDGNSPALKKSVVQKLADFGTD